MTDFRNSAFIVGVRDIPSILKKFKGLQPGLTVTNLAKALNVTCNTAREWAKLANYEAADGRDKEHWHQSHPGGHPKADWSLADWTKTDQEIADVLGVSRTRVWQKRRHLEKQQMKP